MLYEAKKLSGYKLRCRDGEIGNAEEFYFDDQHWTIRYLVANTGGWLTGRRVLLSPHALVKVDEKAETIVVDLTKKQIEDSPTLESDRPVSRQFEASLYGYYGWPEYWSGSTVWGNEPSLMRTSDGWSDSSYGAVTGDQHLRSTRDVHGHDIQATDGGLGHVSDFIIEEANWRIRYLVVSTTFLWPGRKVLISPRWIERVSWMESKVYINLTKEQVGNSPEYSAEALLRRDYEENLHHHYARPGYWIEESDRKSLPV